MLNPTVKKYSLDRETLDKMVEEVLSGIDLEEAMFGEASPRSKAVTVSTGDVIKGNVLQITSNQVVVDYGGKSEAVMPYAEGTEVNTDLDIGDETEFLVTKVEKSGRVHLSRNKIDLIVKQRAALEKLEEGQQVEGPLIAHSKNGWTVDLDGLPAALPTNQAYLFSPPEGPDALLGDLVTAEVENINGLFVTLTRKPFASEVKKKAKSDFMSSLEVDMIVEGAVKNITDFGVFIQIASGVIGLCHTSDLGDSKLEPGDKVKARVVKIDKEKNRIFLGIRQVTEPTWKELVSDFTLGSIVKAKVKRLVNYGAFMELGPGIDGLIHVSDLSWSDHIKHPREVLEADQEMDVVVLAIDAEKKHLSLGLKQINPDPWELVTDSYLVGSKVEGEVTNKTNFGVFVRLEPGVDGLAHHSVETKDLEVGDIVLVSILRIDVPRKRIQLAVEG